MQVTRKQKLVAAGVAAVAVAGGGAAVAASKFGSPSEESTAVVNDAANRLGVQPSALSDALKKALEDRVDAAVAAGRLTQAQGDEMKSRIESGAFPLFFGGRPGGFHHRGFGGLDAAATYLGSTTDELRTQLESVERLTPTGVQTRDGRERELDCVIYGTGFKAHELVTPLEVHGRHGRTLDADAGGLDPREPQAAHHRSGQRHASARTPGLSERPVRGCAARNLTRPGVDNLLLTPQSCDF